MKVKIGNKEILIDWWSNSDQFYFSIELIKFNKLTHNGNVFVLYVALAWWHFWLAVNEVNN